MVKVRCNMCMWIGNEEDLELCYEDEETGENGFNGCPNCMTDAGLIDLIDDEPVTIEDIVDYATDYISTDCHVEVKDGMVAGITFTLHADNEALKKFHGVRISK